MSSLNPSPIIADSIFHTTSTSYAEIISAAANTNGVIITGIVLEGGSTATDGARIATGAGGSEVPIMRLAVGGAGIFTAPFKIAAGTRLAAAVSTAGSVTITYKVL